MANERRADAGFWQRIDERTINIQDMMVQHAEWQKKHQEDDDAKEARILSLENTRLENKTTYRNISWIAKAAIALAGVPLLGKAVAALAAMAGAK